MVGAYPPERHTVLVKTSANSLRRSGKCCRKCVYKGKENKKKKDDVRCSPGCGWFPCPTQEATRHSSCLTAWPDV